MRRHTAITLLLLGASACEPARLGGADWVTAVVAADPLFGGGTFARQRLLLDRTNLPAGDAAARAIAIDEQCADRDRAAAALVRELVTPTLAAEVMPFWSSEAGNALALAETVCLAAYRHLATELPAPLLDLVAAGRVGEPAQGELRAAFASTGSPSPRQLALLIAVGHLRPADATAITAFFASEPGRRWLELRQQALARSEPGYMTTMSTLYDKSMLRSVFDLEDLMLPRARFDDAPPSGR